MASITYFNGEWHDGSPAVIDPQTQSFMHGSAVFDGARSWAGTAPDLDRHCARLIRSAEVMGLELALTADQVTEIALEGIRRFPPEAELYIRPVAYAQDGFLIPEPGGTRFLMSVFEAPIPRPQGISVCLSSYRRPWPSMAPTAAKASCLYPITSFAMKEAAAKGFSHAVMRDGDGSVVELAASNLWLVRDGLAITPAPNGTFLNGITRQRVMALLGEAGIEVREQKVSVEDLLAADELFGTGNFAKVIPIIQYEDRHLQPGPVTAEAQARYAEFARGETV